jgi:hypothetical protein
LGTQLAGGWESCMLVFPLFILLKNRLAEAFLFKGLADKVCG